MASEPASNLTRALAFRTRLTFVMATGIALAASAPSAWAQINNPDFESALGDVRGGPAPGTWQALGNVQKIGNCVVGGPGPGVPPFKNTSQVQLSTDARDSLRPVHARDYSLFQNERLFSPFGYNDWRMPANPPYGWIGTRGTGSVNVWYGSMGETKIYTHLSAIKQQISVNAGDVVKARYRFLTDDNVGSSRAKRNKAFSCIADWGTFGTFRELMSNVALNPPSGSPLTGGDVDTTGTGFKYDSGWKTDRRTFNNTETVTLLFGVVNTYSSSSKVSVLLVDDITVSTPGVTVSPSSGASVLQIEEGQLGQDLDVILDTRPTGNVTVTLAPNPQVTVSPASLTFTPSGATAWDTPQRVTVTAVDDAAIEGFHTGSLVISTSTSADTVYRALANQTSTASIIDNDSPGLKVVYPAATIHLTEGRNKGTYTVELKKPPAAPVTVKISSPDGQVYTDKTTLTFTAAGAQAWNVPQTVTVFAVDDNTQEGDHTGTLNHVSSSTDTNYNFASAANPDLSVDTEVNISDNPVLTGGEGSYTGTGNTGGGTGGFGEGSFGFGAERIEPAARRTPVLTTPAGSQGQYTVANVSHRRGTDPGQASTDSTGTQAGSALIAALAVSTLVLLTRLLRR